MSSWSKTYTFFHICNRPCWFHSPVQVWADQCRRLFAVDAFSFLQSDNVLNSGDFAQIGFSVVEKEYMLGMRPLPNNIHVDVLDGESQNATLLTHWHGVMDQDITNNEYVRALLGNSFHVKPVVSSGSTLLVRYTAFGPYGVFKAKFLYYLCGGRVHAPMFIASPLFNATDPEQVPLRLTCVWRLVKPPTPTFGIVYVNELHLPSCCGALKLSSESGKLILLENGTAPRHCSADCTDASSARLVLQQQDNHSLFHQERMKETLEFLEFQTRNNLSTPDFVLSAADYGNSSAMNASQPWQTKVAKICCNLLQALVFDGPEAELRYDIFYPEMRINFTMSFDLLRKRAFPKTRDEQPWYLKYAALVFYIPVGLILGSIIILVHGMKYMKLERKALGIPNGRSESVQVELGELRLNGDDVTPGDPGKSIMKVKASVERKRSDEPPEAFNNSSLSETLLDDDCDVRTAPSSSADFPPKKTTVVRKVTFRTSPDGSWRKWMRRRESDRLNPRDFKWLDGSHSFCTSLVGKAWLDLHPQSDQCCRTYTFRKCHQLCDVARCSRKMVLCSIIFLNWWVRHTNWQKKVLNFLPDILVHVRYSKAGVDD